jgi:hypothetical protein
MSKFKKIISEKLKMEKFLLSVKKVIDEWNQINDSWQVTIGTPEFRDALFELERNVINNYEV